MNLFSPMRNSKRRETPARGRKMQNTGNLVNGRRGWISRVARIPRRGRKREREREGEGGGRSPWPRVYIAAEILFSLVGKQKLSSKATVLHFHLVSPFSTLCISEFAISFSLIPRGEKLPAQVRRNFRNYRPRGIDKPFLFSSSNFLPLSLSLSLSLSLLARGEAGSGRMAL